LPSNLPDVVVPLGFLIGTWRGEGAGAVPGGDGPDFRYAEELTFDNDGSPLLRYATRVTDPEDGRVLHEENGWWRPLPADSSGRVHLEAVLVQASGVVEVLLGGLVAGPSGVHVELSSDVVARIPTAPPVAADKRMYAVRGGKLMYAIDLATTDDGLRPHLAAALEPVDS
jgi:hypothetical protein